MKKIFVVSLPVNCAMGLVVFEGAEDAFRGFLSTYSKRINGRFCRMIYVDSEGVSHERECRMHFIPGVICEFIDEDCRVVDYYAPGEVKQEED